MAVTLGGSNVTFNNGTVQTYASKIGRVVYTNQTAAVTISTINAWSTISGFSAAITPTSTSSKILVFVYCSISANGNTQGNVNNKVIRLLRNGSVVGAATSRGGEPAGIMCGANSFDSTTSQPVSNIYLDSPGTTSACTYTLDLYPADLAAVVGGTYNTTASGGVDGLSSPNSIILMEVLP